MGVANTVINDLKEYQSILEEHPLVIALFTSPYCPACMGACQRFERVAEKYGHGIKSIVLDTTQTPKIEGVDGTPTLVVYKNAREVENLKGIGDPQDQEAFLEDVFKDYVPTAPATPV
ncbi:thioredoxin family protein [Pseudomonas trivialis]|uniref:thioredoxin family protein n=1 Tax=Pseudomonas trivialis TaxID=200450 RepID=UPI0030CC471C